MTNARLFSPSSGLMPDIAGTLFERADEVCVFGEPPPRLVEAHHAAFVNGFWMRMVEVMLRPAEVDSSTGMRRVQILGQTIFEFAADGSVDVREWGDPPHWGSNPLPSVCASDVPVTGIPPQAQWIRTFRRGFRFELRQRTVAPRHVQNRYTRWLFERIVRRIGGDFDLGRMHSEIDRALKLDPSAVGVARALVRRAGRRGPATMAEYNHVMRCRGE